MPDPRFFESLGPASLLALAQQAGASIANDAAGDRQIHTAAPLDRAGANAVTFFNDRRYGALLRTTSAAACFVRPKQADQLPPTCIALITAEPQVAYVRAADQLHRPRMMPTGKHQVDPSVHLEEGVLLGPGVVIGADAQIGRDTRVGPNTVIGPGVAIGRGCHIGPNVTIACALIGDRVRILAGAVIGESGFGVAVGQDGAIDIPQLGRVILQNGVSVGAGSCVDRGAWDDTVVGENTKIDNLVQIAHNVRLGRNCMVAAHTGISGSVVVGDGVRFGGRAGIADHLTIGDGATVMAAAGLMHDIPPGEVWGGIPATPARRWMRQVAWLARQAQGRGESRVNDKD